MKSPIYVATMLLGVSMYCAGSENAGKTSTTVVPPAPSVDVCIAGDGQGPISEIIYTVLPEEAKNRLNDAYFFGFRRALFWLHCESPDRWTNAKKNVDDCTKLVAAIHESYRKVSREAIKSDDLVEVSEPWKPGLVDLNKWKPGLVDLNNGKSDIQRGFGMSVVRPSSEIAHELYQKKYGLKKDSSLRMLLDKDGELKIYYYDPNKPINYIPTQKSQ